MFRLIVSLLLLPCVLLTQSVVFGHAHDGSQPAGHDLRPHIHTSSSPAGHTHDHGHNHYVPGGHHLHHDDGNVPEPDSQPTPQPELFSDHDSDAFYIDTVDAIINVRYIVDKDEVASALGSDTGLSEFVHFSASPTHEFANWKYPPSTGCRCALYVLHLSLLI
jgi:hypothetical protein